MIVVDQEQFNTLLDTIISDLKEKYPEMAEDSEKLNNVITLSLQKVLLTVG
tara:strand:- start:431 stop:583 length:153 start_codon:yes stop_codon:yes gene_type:complete